MDKAVFCDSFGGEEGGNETPRYVRRGFAELFTKAGAEKKAGAICFCTTPRLEGFGAV